MLENGFSLQSFRAPVCSGDSTTIHRRLRVNIHFGMHFVLVIGRNATELFSYDTDTGEQEYLDSCQPPTRVMPSMLAAAQRKTACEYSRIVQQMLVNHTEPDIPVILATERQLSASFVKMMIDNFRHTVRSQCSVKEAGQMGLNEVIQEQLTMKVDPPPPPSVSTPVAT